MNSSQIKRWIALFTGLCFWGFSPVLAEETETLYLSGRGLNDTKTWQFYCSGGMNSGKWKTIQVPSQWELQGFGAYTFGRFYLDKTAKPSDEMGMYRYDFKIPAEWQDKQVEIVFEGVMTDTEVKVNGQLAGALHQGGFYKFSYDITDKLKIGKKNLLEVKVWKESSDKSVNAAERRADWWLFGGIYRPVYLVAKPKVNIRRIAVDAGADGSLSTRLFTKGVKKGYSAAFSLVSVENNSLVGRKVVNLLEKDQQDITTAWEGIRLWNCEDPNLYNLKVELIDEKGIVRHVCRERIGFRTVEFRPQDGFYVNGTKIILKGINRHCFHPDGGRTTDKAISIQDVQMIKSMNMNAIRSHYSPDRHLLEVCDSLGVFYLDEFTGWHGKYDTAVGRKLLEEMITSDANHPCVFLWSNGNEGGWNKNLDTCFAELDLQKRHVIHAWSDFNGVDTHHYPAYQTGTARLANGYKVFMPTEFFHAQYDKGGGAGLEDYWENYSRNPMFAGGFIWTFVDEAVKRVDKGGILDSDGPNGPDGIVGPYREKEGSYYTIREVWSPVKFSPFQITPSFNGEFFVSNKYLFTNLRECRMTYRVLSILSPLGKLPEKQKGIAMEIARGNVVLPSIDPGETGKAKMTLPKNFFEGDILELEVFDKFGRSVCNRSFPLRLAKAYFERQYRRKNAGQETSKADMKYESGRIILAANSVTASFDATDGRLIQVVSGQRVIPLTNGPLPVGMKADFKAYEMRMDGNDVLLVVKYIGAVDSIVWRMTPDGLLGMDAVMLNRGNGGGYKGDFYDKQVYNLGLTFSFPEQKTQGVQWFGRGPYRVWKNRIPGTNYGLWEKPYNNTITGESFSSLVYPEFKGYHANLYWASVLSNTAPFTVYSETDGIYLRLFTPEEPAMRRNGENTMQEFPVGDISFLYEIPGIRSFKTLSEQGPRSQPSTIRIKSGDEGLHMKLWFDFR